MTFTSYKNGRPRKGGDRYPSGKLKPPKPNAKVVAMRRAILGAKEGDIVDLSKAENPMDLALARGWMTERRNRAGQVFADLYRGIRMPALKVSRDTSEFATSAPSPVERYMNAEEGLEASGVVLPVDRELGVTVEKARADFNAGRITQQQYGLILAKADKKHRSAKIEWSQLPSADVARLFDAVMSAARSGGRGHLAEPLPTIPERLREVWSALKPEEARELFSVCCLGRWPEWLIQRVRNGGVEEQIYRRRRKLLEAGLDKVVECGKATSSTPAVSMPQPVRNAIISPGPKAPVQSAQVYERAIYVDQNGAQLFEVERKRRFSQSNSV